MAIQKIMILVILFTLAGSCDAKNTNVTPQRISTNFNTLSEQLLQNIIDGRETKTIEEELASVSLNHLKSGLKTDTEKYAFWINIYNAYIQIILKENPEEYIDKKSFFSKEQILIAGVTLSFDKIEHGFLRKSQWKLGLGYFRKWFPSKLERNFRVEERDFRIHFALNCGAKDCPPVAIYTQRHINEQLEKATQTYLERTTSFDQKSQVASITALFSWFRGDFGGNGGVKKILKKYGQLAEVKGVDLKYKNYDWTLELDNFIDL